MSAPELERPLKERRGERVVHGDQPALARRAIADRAGRSQRRISGLVGVSPKIIRVAGVMARSTFRDVARCPRR